MSAYDWAQAERGLARLERLVLEELQRRELALPTGRYVQRFDAMTGFFVKHSWAVPVDLSIYFGSQQVGDEAVIGYDNPWGRGTFSTRLLQPKVIADAIEPRLRPCPIADAVVEDKAIFVYGHRGYPLFVKRLADAPLAAAEALARACDRAWGWQPWR